jgi:lysophospholipase L1-like esterase
MIDLSRRNLVRGALVAPLALTSSALAAETLEEQCKRELLPTMDSPQLAKYREDNARLIASRAPVDVVFMGDSITEGWQAKHPAYFANTNHVCRGISGQTTPQMVLRMMADVMHLKPKAVHIMAGTNDIAGNTGAATMATVEGNIQSMADLARAHGIKVILASIPPAAAFPWSPGKQPVPQITALNAWLKSYAAKNGFTYVDYHSAMAGPDGGMKPGLSSDGVHPTPAGYAVMRPLTLAAIDRALGAGK